MVQNQDRDERKIKINNAKNNQFCFFKCGRNKDNLSTEKIFVFVSYQKKKTKRRENKRKKASCILLVVVFIFDPEPGLSFVFLLSNPATSDIEAVLGSGFFHTLLPDLDLFYKPKLCLQLSNK